MDSIEQLLIWATSQSIRLDGITPKALPGRGIGMIATRDLKANETVLTVPTKCLRTLDNTPKSIKTKLKGATVHAILSTSLCFDIQDTPAEFEAWKAVFPTKNDFITIMPLCWPQELAEFLPLKAKYLLKLQRVKFEKDWTLVGTAYPEILREDFLYAWLIMNTHVFYHTTPNTKRKLSKEDHMVLQPVADLFNHSSTGCAAAFNAEGFTITTSVVYKEGEEIFLRYGAHSNDFLLVEYGFTIPSPENQFDETSLDAYLLPKFTAAQKERLQDEGFWAGYMIDSKTTCYRTQTALRLLCLSEWQWRAVLDGERDEDEDQGVVNKELLKVLKRYEKDARGMLSTIDDAEEGDEEMKRSLRERWIQIRELIDMAASRISD